MSITTDALSKAKRLNEIGFPEFTAKLISDVFNAIVSANMNQTQAYLELVKELSKTLTTYVQDTKNDISGTDILNFLVKVAPDINNDSGTLIREDNSGKLTAEQVTEINTALQITDTTLNVNVTNVTETIKDQYKDITTAVAMRIAADKYSLLKEMVKMGVLRLVVNGGEIQTSLNFDVADSSFYEQQSEKYNSSEFNFGADVSSGTAVSQWINITASTKYTSLATSTVKLNNNSTSSTTVQIAGSVKLNFSTDYQPLNLNNNNN